VSTKRKKKTFCRILFYKNRSTVSAPTFSTRPWWRGTGFSNQRDSKRADYSLLPLTTRATPPRRTRESIAALVKAGFRRGSALQGGRRLRKKVPSAGTFSRPAARGKHRSRARTRRVAREPRSNSRPPCISGLAGKSFAFTLEQIVMSHVVDAEHRPSASPICESQTPLQSVQVFRRMNR